MLTTFIHEEQNLPLAPFRLMAEAPDRRSWKRLRRCQCRCRFHWNHHNCSCSHFHYPHGSGWTEIGSSQGLDRRIHRSQAMQRRGRRPRHCQLEIPLMGSWSMKHSLRRRQWSFVQLHHQWNDYSMRSR